jgi:epoxyqueuosine reductase
MSLTSNIKEYALSLGYDRVGFTTAADFPIYRRELTERGHMYDWTPSLHAGLLRTAEPHGVFPEARSTVVAVYGYFKHSYPSEMVGRVGRYYQSLGGVPQLPMHGARYRLLKEFMEKAGCRTVGGGAPPPRLASARAGTTTFGKNCFAFAGSLGSFLFISTFLVDAELDHDEPTMAVRCPEKCTLCIDACPTGALYEPLRMNPRRCIAFNSYTASVPVIPPDLREGMGDWVFGCDVCQEACPRNKAPLRAKLPPNAYLEAMADDLRPERLIEMTDESFASVGTLLNYIKEKRFFQRNAAVALGNRGDPDSVPVLKKALRDGEEVVRGHAAWALGRIGGGRARAALEASLSGETSEYVRGEIASALTETAG